MTGREPADAMWRDALAAQNRDGGVSIAERAAPQPDDLGRDECDECAAQNGHATYCSAYREAS
jgi:hypothetical protein